MIRMFYRDSNFISRVVVYFAVWLAGALFTLVGLSLWVILRLQRSLFCLELVGKLTGRAHKRPALLPESILRHTTLPRAYLPPPCCLSTATVVPHSDLVLLSPRFSTRKDLIEQINKYAKISLRIKIPSFVLAKLSPSPNFYRFWCGPLPRQLKLEIMITKRNSRMHAAEKKSDMIRMMYF